MKNCRRKIILCWRRPIPCGNISAVAGANSLCAGDAPFRAAILHPSPAKNGAAGAARLFAPPLAHFADATSLPRDMTFNQLA